MDGWMCMFLAFALFLHRLQGSVVLCNPLPFMQHSSCPSTLQRLNRKKKRWAHKVVNDGQLCGEEGEGKETKETKL